MSGEIFACRPPRGLIVHLYVEGYRPGAKSRPLAASSALCGVSIGPHSPPPYPSRSPLSEALEWTLIPAGPSDPRPSWKWCHNCIGHAVNIAGLAGDVLKLVAARVGEDTE